MKNKWMVSLLVVTLLAWMAFPAVAQETSEVPEKPIDKVADKTGQALVFVLGIPMFLGSIPAWIWDQVGNAADGFSDDTAEKPVPVQRGTDAIPDDVKEQIPHQDISKGT